MLLPSIMSGGIQSEMTRFIIAATSITQLIYLSEVGALLLGSKIPVNIKELFIIFIERTLITLSLISKIY
jgi:nucleoside recognition membrane protein YjiH